MTSTPSAFLGPRIAVVAFAVMTAAFGLNFAAGQFLAPFGREEGWGVTELSLIAGLNAAVAGLVQPLAGRLVDRIGARAVIACAIAALAAAYVLLAAARELWQLVAVYGVLAGAAFGASSSMAVGALISTWYVRRRAQVLARVFMGINAGQLTLGPLAGLLIDASGPRTAALVLGLVVLVAVAPAAALGLRSRPADVGQHPDGAAIEPDAAAHPQATLAEALRDADWWRLTLVFGVNGATLYLALLHLPRLAEDAGGGPATGGALIAVAAALSAVSMAGISTFAARIDVRRLVGALLVLRAAALLAAAVGDSVAALFIAAALFGASSFVVIPLIVGTLGQRFGARAIGAVLGASFVVHQTSAGLAVAIAGLVRDRAGTYGPAFATAAVLALLAAALVRRVTPAPAAASGPAPIRPSHHPIPEGGTA